MCFSKPWPVKRILIAAILLLVASEVFFLFKNRTVAPEKIAQSIQDAFSKMDLRLRDRIDFFEEICKNSSDNWFTDPIKVNQLESWYEKDGQVFFVFRKDSLTFWSNNAVPFSGELQNINPKGVVLLPNGWFFYRLKVDNGLKIIGLNKIYSRYKYQNRFLVNDFFSGFPDTKGLFFVSEKGDQVGHRVLDSEGDFAFSMIQRRETGLYQLRPIVFAAAVLLGMLALLAFGLYLFRFSLQKIQENGLLSGILWFAFLLVGVRLLVFFVAVPSALYKSSLFGPEFFASSYFLPSLGDLLLNVLTMGFLGFFLYSTIKDLGQRSRKGFFNLFWAFLLFGILLLMCHLALYTIKGLVVNSQLKLDVSFVFEFSFYNLVGYLIIACVFFTIFFYSQIIMRLVLFLVGHKKAFGATFVICSAVLFFLYFLNFGYDYLLWLFFLSSGLVFSLGRGRLSARLRFSPIAIAFFLFSIVSTIALYQYNGQKSQQQRKALALSLSSDQDHLAEFLFLEMQEALFNDHQLKNLVLNDPLDEAGVYRYLQHHYFYDYWEKYEIKVTICESGEKRLVYNIEMALEQYFEDIINEWGRPTLSDKLIFLDNQYYAGRKSYLSEIPIEIRGFDEANPAYWVFLEFNTKFGVRETGLPELLVDDKAEVYRGFEELSYAKYVGQTLVHKIGNYVYSFDLGVYGDFPDQFTFFYIDGHEHLVFKKAEDHHIVVSRPKNSFLENIAPFSYMFVLILLISLLVSRNEISEWLQMTYKRRVQLYMVGLVAFSVVSIGVASTFFLIKVYQDKNLDILNEKSQSILFELQGVFVNQERLEDYDYFVYEELLRVNKLFFTDVSVYGPGGQLVATSRPGVFEDGLVGKNMNPAAFANLRMQQKGQFVHNEKIGKLEFVSSYLPLHNHTGRLIGYVNLPYFAKQSLLHNEIAMFVLAFVNINTILLIVALVLALAVSGYVTAPLQLIRDSISRLQLGKANQKIEWKRNDEIGNLVKEYNRMIDELGKSAEILARSERESAWREMAKQVAHEIKNPLTPMRLSIQHLQKAYKDNQPGWEERLEKFSKTMIDQIDNLSVIASAFFDFARMPAGNKAPVDLKKFVPEIIELFNNNEIINIKLIFEPHETNYWVFADRNQLTRVFNNLVNNSIQAYGKGQKAQVNIVVKKEKGEIKCTVKDWGSGIPEEVKRSIFTPYFTTKSGGMGLGLSMVKSIVENHGGVVSFDSKPGESTIFSFSLPSI